MRALAVVLFASACQENSLYRASTTDHLSQVASNEVDVLWVIDNSTSMNEEQDSVAAAASDFMAQLETANMDFHLGVVNTNMDSSNEMAGVLLGNPPFLTSECRIDGDPSDCVYASQFASRVLQGTSGSDQEKGLQAALTAVTPPVASNLNAGFLRDDALLMIIVLSDENDCSDGGALGADATGEDCYNEYEKLLPVADLARDLRDVKKGTRGSVVLSGIVGPDVVDNCEHAVPGKRYRTAIEMLGGVEADICLADYSPIMESLGLDASDVRDTFQLTHAADPDTLEVEVVPAGEDGYAVEADDENGWTYIAEYAQIRFNGTSVPPRGSSINVHYTIAGQVPTPEDEA